MKCCQLILRMFFAVIAFATPAVWGQTSPLSYVNTAQGTNSIRDFSHGNTLPIVGPPWAMTDWSIQNQMGINERWFYVSKSSEFYGFRATHQPCPWAGDYGHVLFMPETGPLELLSTRWHSSYEAKKTVLSPDYMRVELEKYKIVAEMTASERCGIIRVKFNGDDRIGRIVIFPAGTAQLKVDGKRITGFSKYHGGKIEGDFHSYFVGELSQPIVKSQQVGVEADSTGGLGYIEFAIPADRTVELKIATSYISPEQAWQNLRTETRGGFDAVRETTAGNWKEKLGRISIEATEEQKATFYSCLFRALKYPHRFFEIDQHGKQIHFSPWDGKIHDGPEYVDSGLWDTFRTQFPMYSIIYPEQLGEIVAGWLNAYREGGWLPMWPNPGGYRGMPGSHADVMIADAMSKGIKGFDYKTAYEALRKDAYGQFVQGQKFGGREGIVNYEKLGYLPAKSVGYWVSDTLDYAYDDWCVAQAAKVTHHDEDYRDLMARSMNYKKLWDSETKFMRGKKPTGEWAESNFDPLAWGDGYAESGAWQTSFAVQHDPAGLADLLGGLPGLATRLDEFFIQPSTFHVGAYKQVIHEMAEFAAVKMGQYAANNQPSFHIPYLYAAAGQPWKTEYWTRRACDELFNAGVNGFPGDEDNGSMSSWYILSSLGIYPLTPGQSTYVLTSPVFKSAKIKVVGGTFTINADNNSSENVYVQSRVLNGEKYSNTWIDHSQIVKGGGMITHMGEKPAEREIKPSELPYSAKNELAGN